jgi:sigma-B regulation protein RsbU (phosphoserine phosphatase)
MLVLLVDPIGRRVHYIRAGHNPPLMISKDGHQAIFENGGGPPVGLFPALKFRREIAGIESGSVLVLYTDGVTEAEDRMGEQFGINRLVEVVRTGRVGSASRIHGDIRDGLKTFVKDEPTHDDSTLVVLKFS